MFLIRVVELIRVVVEYRLKFINFTASSKQSSSCTKCREHILTAMLCKLIPCYLQIKPEVCV